MSVKGGQQTRPRCSSNAHSESPVTLWRTQNSDTTSTQALSRVNIPTPHDRALTTSVTWRIRDRANSPKMSIPSASLRGVSAPRPVRNNRANVTWIKIMPMSDTRKIITSFPQHALTKPHTLATHKCPQWVESGHWPSPSRPVSVAIIRGSPFRQTTCTVPPCPPDCQPRPKLLSRIT